MPPDIETKIEGPFGEWWGYYAGGARPHPIVKVKAILHRNDPIIFGAPPLVGPVDYQDGRIFLKSAALWEELDKQVPGVKGVWFIKEARGGIIPVISIKQQYSGHAKQVALAVAGSYKADISRFIIIVDDDIDPSNISEILWALGTRCDPATSIDVIDGCWSIASDPRIPPDKKDRGEFVGSRAMIFACKPYSWFERFPTAIKSKPEVLDQVKAKWGKQIFGEML